MSLIVKDCGLLPYGEALAIQQSLFNERVDAVRKANPSPDNALLLLEHFPVITLGKHARETNMLLSEKAMKERGVDVFHIERGGDVTFHGPGQLVVYPILNLRELGIGVKDYVNLLEEVVIRTIARYGITGERDSDAAGVWLLHDGNPRKICALGIKISRSVTMHGLALNLNTDLNYFNIINPCGFTSRGVTSISLETSYPPTMPQLKAHFVAEFINLTGL